MKKNASITEARNISAIDFIKSNLGKIVICLVIGAGVLDMLPTSNRTKTSVYVPITAPTIVQPSVTPSAPTEDHQPAVTSSTPPNNYQLPVLSMPVPTSFATITPLPTPVPCDWSVAEQKLQDTYNSKKQSVRNTYDPQIAAINQAYANGYYSSSAEYLIALGNAQDAEQSALNAVDSWYSQQKISNYCS